MPRYVQKDINSDLSPAWSNTTAFDKEISDGVGTDASVVVSLTALQTKSGSFITVPIVPKSNAWEDGGTWTLELQVDASNMDIDARCRCVRLDSTGTILQSGAFTSPQALNTNRNFSPVAPTWTNGEEDCANRLAIEVEFIETANAANSVTIGLGTLANEVVTDISRTCDLARYVQKDINSDLTPFTEFNKEMSVGVGTDSSVVVALTADEVVTGAFITAAAKPNSDQWESDIWSENGGSFEVEVEVDVTNMDIDLRVRAVRLNSTGTVLQSGAYTAAQNLSGSRVFEPVAPTWTPGEEACGNRLAIELEFTETGSKANSATIGLGTAANESVSGVIEDVGSCVGLIRTVTEAVGLTDATTFVLAVAEFTTTRPAYWNFGVWRNSVGDAYTATAQKGTDQHRRLTVWKSTDDGATWEDVHTFAPVAGTYTNSGQPFEICMGLLDGSDILHIFWNPDEDTNDKELQYCAWDTSDDTVEFAPEIAYAVGVTGRTVGSADVGIRGTGELVCAFREDPTDGSGEISMIRGTQGSWTSHTDISTGDGIGQGPFEIGVAVAGNDDVHVVWQDSPIIHRVLRANNTLSTIDTGNAGATTIAVGPGNAEIFDGKFFYARLASDGVFKPTVADGTVAEDIAFTNRFLDADQPDRNTAGSGVSMAQAGGRLIMGWVQEDTQEAVWLEYNPSTDLWGTTPQGTGVTVAEGADVIFDAWVRGGNVYALVLENPDATVDNDMGRALTEDLVGTEVSGTSFTEVSTEAVGVTDDITPVKAATQAPTEALGVTDDTSRVHTAKRTPAEAVGIGDLISTVKAITPAITEAVGLTDTIAAIKAITSTVTDPVGVTDTTTPAKTARQTPTEDVGITDSTSRVVAGKRTSTEVVGLTDVVSPVKTIRITISEAVGVADVVDDKLTIAVDIFDPVGVTDSTTRVHDAKRTRIEDVGIGDVIAAVKTITPAITEALGLTDTLATVKAMTRAITETVGVTDLIAAAKTIISPAIAEAIGLSDSTTPVKSITQTPSESVGLTDPVTVAKTIKIEISEAVGVTELVVDVLSGDIFVTIAEPVGITDSTTRIHNAKRTSDESVGLTDTVTPAKTIRITISEAVGVTDVVTPAKTITTTVTESVGVTDFTSRIATFVRGVTEALGMGDTTTSVKTIARSVNEPVGLLDVVADVLTAPPPQTPISRIVPHQGVTVRTIPHQGGTEGVELE